jgi:hypothetical protein
VLANPVARLGVVRMGVFREARSFGLLGREEPLLTLGDLIEPPVCFCARFGQAQYLNLIEVLCKIRSRRRDVEQSGISTSVS